MSFALATSPQFLPAQQLRSGALVGRVVASDGGPVVDAILRATRGTRTVMAYSDEKGEYRLGGLSTGSWTVSVRRTGYLPSVLEIDLPAAGLRRDLTLSPRANTRDPALVPENWVGVRGVVDDARTGAPLEGASLLLMGSDSTTHSDASGAFALRVTKGRPVVLKVERGGFVTRLVTGRIPEGGFLEIDVGLDTAESSPKDAWLWRDLEARLKFATPRAALIDHAELMKAGGGSLWTALENSESIARSTIVITRSACIFVNGIPRPGVPVDALFTSDLEFVEVYPPGSELTRTLVRSWPMGAECGVRGAPSVRYGNPRQTAQFISVWERNP